MSSQPSDVEGFNVVTFVEFLNIVVFLNIRQYLIYGKIWVNSTTGFSVQIQYGN